MDQVNDIFQSTNKKEIIAYIDYLDMIMEMMQKREKPCDDLLEEKRILLERIKKLESE